MAATSAKISPSRSPSGRLMTHKSMRAMNAGNNDEPNLTRANSGRIPADFIPSAGSSPAVSRSNSGIGRGNSNANINRTGSLKILESSEVSTPHVTPIGEFKPKRDEFYTANACCCVIAGCQFVDMKHAYFQLEMCCMRQDICCVGVGNDVCIIGPGADIDSCCAVGLRCCSFSFVTPKGICLLEHHCCCCHAMGNLCHPEGFSDMPIACSVFGLMAVPICGCCVKLSTAVEYNGSWCYCI